MITYLEVSLLVLVMNIIPFLMPPTWIILATIYNLNSNFNPVLLAFFGAAASTCGRFILAKMGFYFKNRFLDKRRIKEMKTIGQLAKQNPFKAFILVFLFIVFTPFPSNAFFIIVGFSEAFSAFVFLGFFAARLVQYYFSIISVHFIVSSINSIFKFSISQIIVTDIIATIILVIFSLIDWKELIINKKFKLIPFKF